MECTLQSREFRAVLFDVDGTLVNSIPMIVAGLGDAFEQFTGNRPDDAFIKSPIGTPLTAQMMMYGMNSSASTTLESRVQYTMDRYVAHADKIIALEPAERAYRAVLDAGIPCGLVTSRNRNELTWILGEFPQFQGAQVTISASDVTHPKPHAEPVLRACELLGVDAAEVCFIGDAIHDVESAHAAGAFSVAVAYGAMSESALAESKPNELLLTPSDLESWVEQTILKKEPCYSTIQNVSSP